MAKRKEVSRRELEARRERQNIEKEKDRMLKEIVKKHQLDQRKDKIIHDIVVVSDNSESEESYASTNSTTSMRENDEYEEFEDDEDVEEEEEDNDEEVEGKYFFSNLFLFCLGNFKWLQRK